MKRIPFLICFLLSISALSQEWTQDTSKTAVTFTIRNFGVNVDGQFNNVLISTNFNTDDLPQFQLKAIIKVKSIDTGIKGRDEHILEMNYFDAENHPFMTLESKSLRRVNGNDYLLKALLTIKGKQKQIEVPMQIREEDNQLELTSKFVVNRKDFEVGGGSLIMSKNVKVSVTYYGNR